MPRGRKKCRNGLTSMKCNGATSDQNSVPGNSRINSAVTHRIMSPVGRGMSEDSSPSPTTPPKLKKMPGTSTLEEAAASSRAKCLKATSAKITDYFSQSVELSATSNTNHLTNGDVVVSSKQHDFQYPVCDILNGDIKPMILDNVLVSGIEDQFEQAEEGSDIIYASPEELEEDSCSRDSSSFGYSGEDSGPGKENEDWRAKPVARSLVRAPSDGVDNIQLPTHQSNGIQVNQNNCNVKNYQSTNFMLNNIGGTKRKEKHNTNSFYNNIKDVDGSKMNYDYTDTSTACNKNSNSNHSSPLQPRRVMTRSHTAKNNNTGMSDKRHGTSGINNNSVVASSPSKSDQMSNGNQSCNSNEVRLENETTVKQIPNQIKSNNNTPTKKSVASSILSFTSSILAAAAASATTEALSSSPEQSPTKDRRKVIDLSSSHSSPLKRSSTPSASPTRRGGRATKPSPHQGTPPQSPPTPHKIICQATVETIDPVIQETSSEDAVYEETYKNNRPIRSKVSPNISSTGSKLISSLSPKKNSLSTEKKSPLDQRKGKSDEVEYDDHAYDKAIGKNDETPSMQVRRNLTTSFMSSNTCEASAKINGSTVTGPKKRVGNKGSRVSSNDTGLENNNESALISSNRMDGSANSKCKSISSSFTNSKVTDFFPIRRSERKPKTDLASKQLSELLERLMACDKFQSENCKENKDLDENQGIGIKWYDGKGRGIEARRRFTKGDFVVEYAGDIIEGVSAAKTREGKYAKDSSKGCYMYYFKHGEKNYCIDATGESGRLGRLVNHSRVQPNLQTKVVIVKDTPRLLLVAKKDIEPGTELLYDYGDRSKESLICHPWLAL